MERYEFLTDGDIQTVHDRVGGLLITLPAGSAHLPGEPAGETHPSYDAMFRHPDRPLAVRIRHEPGFADRLAARGEAIPFDLEGWLLSYARTRCKDPIRLTIEPLDDAALDAMDADAGAFTSYELARPEGDYVRELTLCLFRHPSGCYTINVLSGLPEEDPAATEFAGLVLGGVQLLEG